MQTGVLKKSDQKSLPISWTGSERQKRGRDKRDTYTYDASNIVDAKKIDCEDRSQAYNTRLHSQFHLYLVIRHCLHFRFHFPLIAVFSPVFLNSVSFRV